MADRAAKVYVLYSHPLLGEGLARLLADEHGLDVEAIELADADRVQAAIASDPAVIVVEEGGRLDGIDVLRQAGSPVILDVDIRSMEAWAFHRDHLASRPETLIAAVRDAVGLPAEPSAPGTPADDPAEAPPHHAGASHLRHAPATGEPEPA